MTNEMLVQALLYILFGLSWANILFTLGVVMMLVLFWRLNVDKRSKFDIDDMFLSEATRKADLYKVTIAVMAALAVATIIALLEMHEITAVVTLMPTVLGIFVLGRGAQMIWGQRTLGQPDQGGDKPAAPVVEPAAPAAYHPS